MIDLADPALYAHGVPHDALTELRARGAVHRQRAGDTDFWAVVRHAEVQAANRDWETFSAADGVTIPPQPQWAHGNSLVSLDPPDHSRLRHTISSGFTPRMIAKLEDHIAARTDAILDEAGRRGTVEFVRDIAYQLPMHVIADIVGVPEDERPWVFTRTEAILRELDNTEARIELFRYAQELTERKRREPADDVWTLLASQIAEGMELEMFFLILSIAGSETTRNALSQGLLALLDHPDQLAELRDRPSVVASATEEIIRWSSPVLYFGRTATRDVDLGGVPIGKGDRVVLWYPSANRDERVFEDPFRFDIHRDPNPHVSFGGGGPHYCLGANLAKKEIAVLLPAVLRRFDVRLAGEPDWAGQGPRHNVGVSIDRMPVELSAR